MTYLIERFLCFLYLGHFTRRTPFIAGRGPNAMWRTRVRCWCGHYDAEVTGLHTYEEAREWAKEKRALLGWGMH